MRTMSCLIMEKYGKENSMKYLNALNKIEGVGPQKIKMLLSFFGSFEAAWKAGPEELMRSGINKTLAEKIAERRMEINPDEEWEKLRKENIKIIALDNPLYPSLLKEIPNPPYVIYVKGELDMNSAPAISIVGSRKYTSYGYQTALSFAKELADAGLIVVSGMAIGIDSFAHQGALNANGATAAVLGSSLENNHIGPRSNFKLAENILEKGALISEYPPGTPANPGLFPARNRLMAGLSLGTLVVEAAENSGSLITANYALEFNREVFAVPGSIFSLQSSGTNNLIKRGAKMAAGISDILEELRLEQKKISSEIKKIIPASTEEKKILAFLSHEPSHIDKIAKTTKLKTNVVGSTLALMEIKGMVKNIGGQNYITL